MIIAMCCLEMVHFLCAFNENKNYVGQIPDSEAVQHTQFYFPGVAYNLIFYFEEI